MPFDNTPPAKTEIDILDEIATTLASPQSWCQRELVIKGNNGSIAYCLYGALNLADHGYPEWYGPNAQFQNKAACKVQEVLIELTAPHIPSFKSLNFIALFNNSHTHQEVLDLIAKARARMS